MFDWFRRKQPAPHPYPPPASGGRAPARKSFPADLEEMLRCGPLSSSGAQVTPERAMRVATVYACVRILAESIAQLPCKVYRRGEGGDETVESGAVVELMRFPNAWQNSFEFREYLMACLCLRGNFFALKTMRRGEVVELLPLRPEAVSVRRRNWEPVYSWTDAEGRTGEAGPERMLHVRGLSLDGLMGVSPIRYGRDAIGLAMATEKHGALMFKNGGRPGGVLTHPGKLSDEALEHLKLSWRNSHGGENAGGTAILEEGMKYESVSMTNEDAQYLDTRQFQRNEICALFRVPPHMIGDLTKSSFSNITQQSLEFVKYSVLPWCRRIETAFWRGLLTEEQRRQGYRVEFLVSGLERADIKTRYESYSIAIQNGILSPNECRRLENRNPREGGDVFLQPLNMVDGRQAGEPAREEEKAATPGIRMASDADAGKPTAGGDEPGEAAPFAPLPPAQRGEGLGVGGTRSPLVRAPLPFPPPTSWREGTKSPAAHETKAAAEDDEPEHDDWASGEWSEESADLNQIMRDFRPKLEKMYREIVANEVAEIRRLVDRCFPEGKQVKSAASEFLAALQVLYDGLLGSMTKKDQRIFADLSANIAVMAARHCGVSKESLIGHLEATVERYAQIEAQDYVDAAVRQLTRLAAGEINPRQALLGRLDQWNATRVDKLTRVAAAHGANWYAHEAYRKAGVTRLKWVANGGKTCNICNELNGKVVGIDDAFVDKGQVVSNGAGKRAYTIKRSRKHPPIHNGCVCAIVPVLETRWIVDENTDSEGRLVNGDRAFAAEEKFTKYSLDLESKNPHARSKAIMFATLLDIKKADWRYLHDAVLDGLQKYRPTQKSNTGHGDKYTVMMPIRGLNGKKAVIETAWQYDEGSDFPRLITPFIPDKNKERRYLFLLDDLEG